MEVTGLLPLVPTRGRMLLGDNPGAQAADRCHPIQELPEKKELYDITGGAYDRVTTQEHRQQTVVTPYRKCLKKDLMTRDSPNGSYRAVAFSPH